MNPSWAKYAPLKEKWRYLGFGSSRFFALDTLFYLRYVLGADLDSLFVYLVSLLISTVAIVMVMRLLEPSRYRLNLGVAVIALCTAGACAILLSGNWQLGACLLGISAGILLNCWGNELADLNERDMVFTALFGWGLSSAFATVLTAAKVNPLLAAVGFCLFSSFTLMVGDFSPSKGKPDQGLEVLGMRSLAYSHRLVASIFILLLTVSAVHFFSRATFFASYYISAWMEMGEEAIGAVILVLLFAFARRVSILAVCRIVLPVAAGALLLTELLPSSAAALSVMLVGSSLTLTRMFLLLATVKFAHDCPQRRWVLFGLGTVIVYGAQLGCVLVSPWILSNVPLASFSVMQNGCLLLLVVVFSVSAMSGRWFSGHEDAPDLRQNRQTVQEAAGRFGLTAREQEVLLLMVDELTEQQIADELIVGKGTVHTHIAHIYKKFGVHGKEDLIELLRSSLR